MGHRHQTNANFFFLFFFFLPFVWTLFFFLFFFCFNVVCAYDHPTFSFWTLALIHDRFGKTTSSSTSILDFSIENFFLSLSGFFFSLSPPHFFYVFVWVVTVWLTERVCIGSSCARVDRISVSSWMQLSKSRESMMNRWWLHVWTDSKWLWLCLCVWLWVKLIDLIAGQRCGPCPWFLVLIGRFASQEQRSKCECCQHSGRDHRHHSAAPHQNSGGR